MRNPLGAPGAWAEHTYTSKSLSSSDKVFAVVVGTVIFAITILAVIISA